MRDRNGYIRDKLLSTAPTILRDAWSRRIAFESGKSTFMCDSMTSHFCNWKTKCARLASLFLQLVTCLAPWLRLSLHRSHFHRRQPSEREFHGRPSRPKTKNCITVICTQHCRTTNNVVYVGINKVTLAALTFFLRASMSTADSVET